MWGGFLCWKDLVLSRKCCNFAAIMRKERLRYFSWGLSVLVGIGVFLFWYVAYPHALSYQEQYQLFLWTGDYFLERVSLPGGFADWLGESIVQFYYIEWLGALLLALLFVALQRLTLRLLRTHGDRSREFKNDYDKIAQERVLQRERLARTLTIFANCKAYNIAPYKYLCDVFRRIKNTAKDQLVNLVAHKW